MRTVVLKSLVMAGGLLLPITPSYAVIVTEDFSSDPALRGWKTIGTGSLFQWSPAAGAMAVTWDSTKPNSFFFSPLQTPLGMEDDFAVTFQLQLKDFAAGIDPAKRSTFQLAVGFINAAEAAADTFIRTTGSDSPDVIDFSFFPDPGGDWQWGPSITTTMIDRTGTNWSSGGFAPEGFATGAVYQVTMVYTSSNHTLSASILRDGEPFLTVPDAKPGNGFQGFRIDALAICSYSDAGQDPSYAGSILAHGTVDNFVLTVPPAPVEAIIGSFTNGSWQVEFRSRTNWIYTLERTTDLQQWAPASVAKPGLEGTTTLLDTNSVSDRVFYRVKSERW